MTRPHGRVAVGTCFNAAKKSMEMNFIERLEGKVREQLNAQRVGYLLGAGSSYLDGSGYPLAMDLWDTIKNEIMDIQRRDEIQAKIDEGAKGIEHALDLLDHGRPDEEPHRHLVSAAIAKVFESLTPPLDSHIEFVSRLSSRSDTAVKVFNLNYDPLIERASDRARVRLLDGFLGFEQAYFEPSIFEERIGRIRGSHKGRQFDVTAKPIMLLKLHGSLGWYDCDNIGVRRCAYSSTIPTDVKRLMIPPQRRKANDTMSPPYSALWSVFRGALGQDSNPINRLVCIGYGFADEHVNSVIESAMARSDFTVLIFANALSDEAWNRWSVKSNVLVITEERCSLKGELGPGHGDLWNFKNIVKEA